MALLCSSFTRVLLVDCDVVPVRNIGILVQSRHFVETGTVFFRDRELPPSSFYPRDASTYISRARRFGRMVRELVNSFPRKRYMHLPVTLAPGSSYRANGSISPMLRHSMPWLWQGNMPPSVHVAESSVLAMDRCRHQRTLGILHATALNVMHNSWGDKETFWIAAELSGGSYSFSPYRAGSWSFYKKGQTPPVPHLKGQYGPPFGGHAHFHPDTGLLLFLHGIKLHTLANSPQPKLQVVVSKAEKFAYSTQPRYRFKKVPPTDIPWIRPAVAPRAANVASPYYHEAPHVLKNGELQSLRVYLRASGLSAMHEALTADEGNNAPNTTTKVPTRRKRGRFR